MHGQRTARRTWLPVLLSAVVAGGLQAVGLVQPIAFLTWGVAAALLLASALVFARARLVSWPAPAKILAALTLVTAVQLLPLPSAVLASLSPVAHELRSLSWVGPAASYFPITMDAPATTAEALKYLWYACLALACAICVRRTRSRDTLVRGLVFAGIAFTVACVAHTLLAPERIHGLYRPLHQTWGLVRGPLVNSNHIASVLAAVAPLTFAVTVGESPWRRRLLLGLGGLEVTLALLTLSRGGGVACVLGLTMLWVWLRRHHHTGRRFAPWQLAAVVGFAVAAALYVALEQFGQVLDRSRPSGIGAELKVRTWNDALQVAGDFWLTGSGRGTFAMVFTRYRTAALPREITFEHVENLPIEMLSEWGAPVTVVILAVAAVWLLRAWRHVGSSRTRAGALAGLSALIAHNFVDFSLELPAIAGLAVVLAVLGEPKNAELAPPSRRIRALAWAFGAAGLMAPALTWTTVAYHSHRVDAERLGQTLQRTSASNALPTAAPVLERHPADFAVPLLLGEWSAHRRAQDTLRWLNRALFLNPRGGGVHLAIGKALARAGHASQALLELRLAQLAEPARGGEIAAHVIATFPRFQEMRSYIGTGRWSGARAISLAEALRDQHRNGEYARVCELLASRSERDLRQRGMICLAEAARILGQPARAESAASALARDGPDAHYVARLVTVLAWAGRRQEAEIVLSAALRRHPDQTDLLAAAAEAALDRGDAEAALAWANRLGQNAGTNAATVAEAEYLKGRSHLLARQPRRALAACERGLTFAPERADILRCLADAAFDSGDLHQARATYREIEALGGGDDIVRERVRDAAPRDGGR